MSALLSSIATMTRKVQEDPDLSAKMMFVASFYGLKVLFPIRMLLQKNLEGLSMTPTAIDVSKRAKSHFMTPPMHYFVPWITAQANQYDIKTNPKGDLPLAVAENRLMAVEMMDKIRSFKGYTKDILYYNDGTGMPVVKDALVKILTKRVYKLRPKEKEISRRIQPEDICVSAGVTAILHQLSMLLFNPGDAVLVPTPYYPAFDHDFWNISDVKAFGVDNIDDPLSTKLDKQSLERGYSNALWAGKKPKALLLTNPGNPLGTVYTPEDLLMAIGWARSKGMHIIVDEIYALTVFNTKDGPEFVSVVNLLDNELGDDIHCLWGMSKDFCANGLRVGVLYTQNKALQQSIGNLSFTFQASNLVQEMTAFVLKDEVFVESYISENKLRLKKSYDVLASALDILNVPSVKAQAAMFCFVDLRCLLKAPTFEAERELFDFLYSEAGIVLTPGRTCHCPIPGWFRICYAWVPLEALVEFAVRLRSLIQSHLSISLPDFEYKYGIIMKKSKSSSTSSSSSPGRGKSLQRSSPSRAVAVTSGGIKKTPSSPASTSTSVVSSLFPSANSDNFSESTEKKTTPERRKSLSSKKSTSTAADSHECEEVPHAHESVVHHSTAAINAVPFASHGSGHTQSVLDERSLSTPSSTPPRKSGLIAPSPRSKSKPSPLKEATTDEVSISALSDSNSSASINTGDKKESVVKKKKIVRKKSVATPVTTGTGEMGPESPTMLSIVPSPSKRMSTIMTDRKHSTSTATNNATKTAITKVSPTTNGKTSRRTSSLL